ncbi:DUF3099 domain-containing protein [Propionibacteriaceae bacterium Y1923]|uniref:DUF3099 domain-containing protein n=1 Tax=Aestuariimicrobium sp. Y1814 TaxID=3418742 RepID=UPI003C232894
MSSSSDGQGFRRSSQRVVVVTQVAESRTEDLNRRRRNYAIAMAIRTLSFVLIFFVPGVWKLVPLLAAAVLPVLAVMFANALDHHQPPPISEEPDPRLALTSGAEIIKGEVVADEDPSATDDPPQPG